MFNIRQVFFFTWISVSLSLALDPVVRTVDGYVKGKVKLSLHNRKFHSFTGVPYAKAPIGDLRFKEPQEPEPWHNFTRDATKDPPACIQRNYLFSIDPPIEGKEDCLYLNVFVPQTNEENTKNKPKSLPVMVFIHWGAFIAGRSTTGYLGPEYFMDNDVILVTFNYRIGPFGFLSTLDDEAPGNYGLKDQIMVLKWVQANIPLFGGDKDKVTIFGQSAGAGSVHLHMLNPASKGLFHRAISQSGNALAGWAQPTTNLQKQIAILQGNFVGCGENATTADLIRCLRAVPADEILKSQDLFKPFFGNPLMVFGTVIETKSRSNPDPFMTKTPLQSILDGEFSKVPWLTGVVKNEGIVRAASLIRSTRVRNTLNQNFEKLVSEILLILSLSTTRSQNLYRNITEFYLNGKNFIDIDDKENIQGFVDVYSDRAFLYPLYQSVILQSQKGHVPIFVYSFEYEGANSYGDLFAMTHEKIADFNWGTSHSDDLLYLFNSPDLFNVTGALKDGELIDLLVDIWTNFAKNGRPNVPKWKPLDLNKTDTNNCLDYNCKFELLNITGNYETGPKLEITKGFYKNRMKFWSHSDIYENQNLSID